MKVAKRVVKQPEVRRLELIMAAQELFITKGYANTSVEAIIRTAGIAKGTFYYYFKTKQDILTALVDYLSAELVKHFQSILATEGLTAIAKLKLMLRGEQKKQNTKPAIMNVLHAVENRELQEQINKQSIHKIAPLLAQVIEQGNAEGIFHAIAPLESMQIILAGSQFILDSGLFNWTPKKRAKLLKALQQLVEQSLDAQPASLAFIATE
jgi:AcrR family transcriptional regulator